MLGCVKEFLKFEVVLGLPSGLKGYMPISSICDAYTKTLSNVLESGVYLEVTGPSLCTLLDMIILFLWSYLQSNNNSHHNAVFVCRFVASFETHTISISYI